MDIEEKLRGLYGLGMVHHMYTENNEHDLAEVMRNVADGIIEDIINYVDELINDRMDLGHLVEELQLKLAKEE